MSLLLVCFLKEVFCQSNSNIKMNSFLIKQQQQKVATFWVLEIEPRSDLSSTHQIYPDPLIVY